MKDLKDCKICEDVVKRDDVLVCGVLDKPCEYVSRCPYDKDANQDEIKAIGLFRSMRPDIM